MVAGVKVGGTACLKGDLSESDNWQLLQQAEHSLVGKLRVKSTNSPARQGLRPTVLESRLYG